MVWLIIISEMTSHLDQVRKMPLELTAMRSTAVSGIILCRFVLGTEMSVANACLSLFSID